MLQFITKICSTHLQRPNRACYFLFRSDPEHYQSGVFLNLWLKQGLQSCKCSCTVSLEDWMEWPRSSSTKLRVNFKYESASIKSQQGFYVIFSTLPLKSWRNALSSVQPRIIQQKQTNQQKASQKDQDLPPHTKGKAGYFTNVFSKKQAYFVAYPEWFLTIWRAQHYFQEIQSLLQKITIKIEILCFLC